GLEPPPEFTSSTNASAGLNLTLQNQSILEITSIQDLNATGYYFTNETFQIQVNYGNTGGTDALAVDGTIIFSLNGYLTLLNDPDPVNVSAGGTNFQVFIVQVNETLTSSVSITIDCNATGVENISSRSLAINSGVNDLDVVLQKDAELSITGIYDITGNGPHVEGEMFQVRVDYYNPGGTDVLNVDGTLSFNPIGYLIMASSPVPVTVPAGGTNFQIFNIQVNDPIASNSTVTIDCYASGTEEFSLRLLLASSGANDASVTVQKKAIFSITSMEDVIGNGTYIEGETFQVQVNYSNTGETDALFVDGTLSFSLPGYLTVTSNPAPINVTAGGTGNQVFDLLVNDPIPAGNPITIDCDATGVEEFSGNPLATSSGAMDVSVNLQQKAFLTIMSILDVIGNGTYSEDDVFQVRVNYSNIGGTNALTVDGTLIFSLNGYFTIMNNPAPVTVAAGETSYQSFNISVNNPIPGMALIKIDCDATGVEEFSNDALFATTNITTSLDIFILSTAVAPPTSNHPTDCMVVENSTGNNISWVLWDEVGAGDYLVLLNSTVLVDWTPWSNGTPLDVPIETNLGTGSWNYTIRYNNSLGVFGNRDMVLVIVDDHPRVASSPQAVSVFHNNATIYLIWVLHDDISDGGTYSIFRDGTSIIINQSWTNGTPIIIPVNISMAIGEHVFTIEFFDDNGNQGSSSSVVVTIKGPVGPESYTIIDFLKDNGILFIFIGIGMVLGIASIFAVKAKSIKKSPVFKSLIKTKQDKLDMYRDVDADADTGVEKDETKTHRLKANYICYGCKMQYDIGQEQPGVQYKCPTCMKELFRVVSCPTCDKNMCVPQEKYQTFQGKIISCPLCNAHFRLK
ncbi:MAG: hypothetical protein ACFFCS_07975, partial [Candidatus Hodarchaeota archaeon]